MQVTGLLLTPISFIKNNNNTQIKITLRILKIFGKQIRHILLTSSVLFFILP